MKSLFFAVAAWAVAATSQQILDDESAVSRSKTPCGSCPRDASSRALGTRLSPNAKVYFPCSDGFEKAKSRWSTLEAPGVKIVVVPGVEEDVDETVKFANHHHIPFLAVTSSHGTPITQGRMQHGIEIQMYQLNSIKVLESGTEARVGGGALSGQISNTLWNQGKQTVTGGSECVGLVGLGFGGGRGFLQGRYGLVADQFTSMNVVLADGSRHTLDKDSDLWWAMRGAGHNFAIVTSFTMKVYDIQRRNWALEGYIFTGDKIEAVHEVLNELREDGGVPIDVSTFGVLANIPSIDSNPVLIQYVGQEGTTVVDATYTDPFRNLGPISIDDKSGIYIDIPSWIDDTVDSPDCQKTGAAHARFPIELRTYNTTGMRQMYDAFAAGMRDTPALIASVVFIEGYPQQGVRAVPQDSSAYALREESITVAPTLAYMPDGPELDEAAASLGQKMRGLLLEASGREELRVYVNYAYGTESQQALYGYEEWRQKRLGHLKAKYDPKGRFNFFNPIE